MVEALIKDGAHILGLTKLSSMIAREEPMDAVDFPAAFNPRGDGYQSPAGSSSGSGAAIASYTWLDYAIGTDTSGSGRRPAMANGIFQFRPTHDLVDLRGMVTTFTLWDKPCLFSRKLSIFQHLLQSWDPSSPKSEKAGKPYEVIYLTDYLPIPNTA